MLSTSVFLHFLSPLPTPACTMLPLKHFQLTSEIHFLIFQLLMLTLISIILWNSWHSHWLRRPSSNAELYMCRSQYQFGSTQIIKFGSWFKHQPNLVELNCKNKRDIIANGSYCRQKWQKKGGKDKLWKCFSCKCDQGGKNKSKKVTTEAVSNKQPKRMSEFGFLLKGIADPKRTSQFLIQFVPVFGFFRFSLFCHFLTKAWLAVCHRTACFPTSYTLMVFKYGTLHTDLGVSTSKYISCSRSKRNTSFPGLPTILEQKFKTSFVHMKKIGNMHNSG